MDLLSFIRGLPLSLKAQFLSQIEVGLCLTLCPVVAQTQGCHLVCIWCGLVKFQRGGVVLKIMLLLSQIGRGLCLAGCHVFAQIQG